MNSRKIVDVLVVIGMLGNAILAALTFFFYFMANAESEDMECFALRHGGSNGVLADLDCSSDISAAKTAKPDKNAYSRVNQREMYSTRTVQLRGQF